MKQGVEAKGIPGGTGEADECLFEYLHAEMVNYVVGKSHPSKVSSPGDLLLWSIIEEAFIDDALIINNIKDGEEELSDLEWMGFGVGYRVIERLTREWTRFKDELDMIKFICTDFWSSLYRKQIDNLRTNHHGVYVLQDNEFRLLVNVGAPGSKQYLKESPRLLAFTCGLLRGSLSNLGIVSTVKAEVSSLPGCKFHVQVQRV